MIELKDQMNRQVRLTTFPKRIVSLVPSQTELLADLGLDEKVVGITKFCIHPNDWFKTKTRIGGTKSLDLEKIKALSPDLIIANKEENTKDQIEALTEIAPIYISDIYTVEDACQMIEDIGFLTNTSALASELNHQIKADFSVLPQIKGKVLYYIWADPYMIAGKNNFIGHLLARLGLENGVEDPAVRYQELDVATLKSINPDIIFLSSEPFPFKEKQRLELQFYTTAKIIHVDGEIFSWYGSRMIKAKAYFEQLARRIG